MQAHRDKPLAHMVDLVGAACAYAVILGMIATALAPLFTPLLQH
jgi:hypothetical protein